LYQSWISASSESRIPTGMEKAVSIWNRCQPVFPGTHLLTGGRFVGSRNFQNAGASE
jgi:hypothetical protein